MSLTKEQAQALLSTKPEPKKATLTREDAAALLAPNLSPSPEPTTPVPEPVAPAVIPPSEPETTWPEFFGGLGLDLGMGTMRATKAPLDLASLVIPEQVDQYVTKPWRDLFSRGIDASEAVKPLAYKQEQKQTFVGEDGLQLPSVEAILGPAIQSIPQLPLFLAGGPAIGRQLMSAFPKVGPTIANALGYGVTNASIVAPQQYYSTLEEAQRLGADPEEAQRRARVAAGLTSLVSGATGTGSGLFAGKMGVEASNMISALLKGFAIEAPFEGTEESLQYVINEVVQGRQPELVQALDTGAVAAASGGLPGAAIAGTAHAANQYVGAQQSEFDAVAAQMKDALDAMKQANGRVEPEFDAEAEAAAEQQKHDEWEKEAQKRKEAQQPPPEPTIPPEPKPLPPPEPKPPEKPPEKPDPTPPEPAEQEAKWAEQFQRDGFLKGVSQKDPNRTLLVSEDTHHPGKYRITFFENGEPTNHMIFDKVGGGTAIDDALRNISGFDIEATEAPEPSVQKTDGEKAEIVPGVTSYRSGASSISDMRGYIEAGVPFGVAVDKLSEKSGLPQLIEAAKSGHQIFIDSGEFSNFRKGERTDFDAVIDRYMEILKDLDDAKNLNFVMPDRIGDYKGTLEELERQTLALYRISRKANVIFPLPMSPDLDVGRVAKVYDDIARGSDYSIGIPSNEEAYSLDDLNKLLNSWPSDMLPRRVHFLGIAAQKDRLAEMRDAVLNHWPGTEITSDANRIIAQTGKIGKSAKAFKHNAGVEAIQKGEGAQDWTEILENFTEWTSRQIKSAAEMLSAGQNNVTEADIKAMMKADDRDKLNTLLDETHWETGDFMKTLVQVEEEYQKRGESRKKAVAKTEKPEKAEIRMGKQYSSSGTKTIDITLEWGEEYLNLQAEKDNYGKWSVRQRGTRLAPSIVKGVQIHSIRDLKAFIEDLAGSVTKIEFVAPADKFSSGTWDVTLDPEFEARWSGGILNEYSGKTRKRTPSEMGFTKTAKAWFRAEYEGRDVATNGHILDLGNMEYYEKHVKKWWEDRHPSAQGIIDQLKNLKPLKPLAEYDANPGKDSPSWVIMEGKDYTVGVDRRYYDHFQDLYGKDITYKQENATSAIAIYKDGKFVAMMMPVKMGGAQEKWTAADYKKRIAPKPEKKDEAKGKPQAPQKADKQAPVEADEASHEYIKAAFEGIEFTPQKLKLLAQLIPIEYNPDERPGTAKRIEENRSDILASISGTEAEVDLLAKQVRSGRNLTARRDEKTGKLIHPNKRRREMLQKYFSGEQEFRREVGHMSDEQRLEFRNQEDRTIIWPEVDKTRRIDIELKKEPFIPITQAEAEYQKWVDYAEQVYQEEDNSKNLIISLYDFTGNWALPWAQAGYEVQLFDVKNGFDLVRDFVDLLKHIEQMKQEGYQVAGVLSACPCDSFTSTNAKDWGKLHDDINIPEVFRRYGRWASTIFDSPLAYAEFMVDVMEYAIAQANPHFWAFENPATGRLKKRMVLPEPQITFNPNNFGADYTKRTAIWGHIATDLPTANRKPSAGSKMQKSISGSNRAERQVTPLEFAYSFFVAQHKAMKDGRLNRDNTRIDESQAWIVPEEVTPDDNMSEGPVARERPEDPAAPVEDTTRKGSPDFTRISFTQRTSIYRDIWASENLDPDEWSVKSLKAQVTKARQIVARKFGFRAINLGPGMPLIEARDQLADAYRNLSSMAALLGLPHKAVGLNKTLTFTMEKNAPYLGAYYPGEVEIRIPGRSNSFGHEWMHALDFYALSELSQDGILDQPKYAGLSGRVRKDGMEPTPNTVEEAYVRLMDNIFFEQSILAADIMMWEKLSESGTDRQKADAKRKLEEASRGKLKTRKNRSGYYRSAKEYGDPSYWTKPTEMIARAYEAYIARRMLEAGESNEFLAKGDENYLSNAEKRLEMTFPKLAERERIFAAFDHLFRQLAAAAMFEGDPAQMPGPADTVDLREFDGVDLGHKMSMGQFFTVVKDLKDAAEEMKQSLIDKPPNPHGAMDNLRIWRQMAAGTNRAMAVTLQKMHPDSAALRELFAKVMTFPGEYRAEGQPATFHDIMTEIFNQYTGRFDRIIRSHDIRLTKLRRHANNNHVLRELLLGNTVEDAPRNIRRAAATIRKLWEEMYYEFKRVGVDLGFVNDRGYLMRTYLRSKILSDAHKADFKRDGHEFMAAAQFPYELGLTYEVGLDFTDQWGGELEGNRESLFQYLRHTLRTAALNDEVSAAFDTFKAEWRDIHKEAQRRSAEEDADIPPDTDALIAAIQRLVDETHQPVREDYAIRRVDSWLTSMHMPDKNDFFSTIVNPPAKFMKRRGLAKEADDMLADWMETYVPEIFLTYMAKASRRIAFVKQFGKAGEEITRLERQMVREDVPTESMELALDMVDRIIGNHQHGKFLAKFSTPFIWLHTLGYMRLLTKATFSSLFEGATYGIRTGRVRDSMAPLQHLILATAKRGEYNKLKEMAQVMNIIGGAASDQIMRNQIGGDYANSPRGSQLLAAYFRGTLLTQLTEGQRAVGLRIYHSFLVDRAKRYLAGRDIQENALILNEFGIPPDSTVEFAKWLVEEDGIPDISELYEMDGRPTPMGSLYMLGLRRFVDQVIQNPLPETTVPLASMGNPILNLVYGITKFSFSFFENVLKREAKVSRHMRDEHQYIPPDLETHMEEEGISEDDRRDRWANAGYRRIFLQTLPMISILIAFQIFQTIVRESIFHADKYEDMDEEERWSRFVKLGLQRSMGLGGFEPLIQYYKDVEYNRDFVYQFVGPAPGWFGQNIDKIAGFFADSNSPKTSTAEYRAGEAIFELTVMPAALTFFSLLNTVPNPYVKGAATSGIYSLPTWRENFASLFGNKPEYRDYVDEEYSELRSALNARIDEARATIGRIDSKGQWQAELDKYKEEFPDLFKNVRLKRYKTMPRKGLPQSSGEGALRKATVSGRPEVLGRDDEISKYNGAITRVTRTTDSLANPMSYGDLFDAVPAGLSEELDRVREKRNRSANANNKLVSDVLEELRDNRRSLKRERIKELRRLAGED